MITLGIEQLVATPPAWLKGKRLGLLCNQVSTDRHFKHSRDLIQAAFPGQLTCLFTPQHGFFSEKQDNMIESDHTVDKATGLPVFSLYASNRRPTAAMFDNLDILLIDLPDVGTRVYTFMYTLAYCLEAAAQYGKKALVLDRPNPIGGVQIEGNLLRPAWRSFVGLYPIPMRHGLTLGELARMMNTEFKIQADLEVIPMQGWQREMYFDDTACSWVYPSPNIPSIHSAIVYPGQVIWEGTNVSEGRGTTLPFELFGAPYLRHAEIMGQLKNIPLAGCHLRPVMFEPTSNKWSGHACAGFQIHVLDRKKFMPYRTSLALLQAIMTLYKDDFRYKKPPYEYEYEKLPLNLILGDSSLRLALESGDDLLELEKSWQAELVEYDQQRRQYFLYEQV